MKRLVAFVFVLGLICALGLVRYSQPQEGRHYFNGVVLEIYEDHLLTECLEDTDGMVGTGDQAVIRTDLISANRVPDLAVGDHIRVVFDVTDDSSPIQVGNVSAIYLLDENGEIIDR